MGGSTERAGFLVERQDESNEGRRSSSTRGLPLLAVGLGPLDRRGNWGDDEGAAELSVPATLRNVPAKLGGNGELEAALRGVFRQRFDLDTGNQAGEVCQAGTPMAHFGTLVTHPWHTGWHSPPPLTPTLPPPPPLPKKRGEKVGVRWGDGAQTVALGVPSWHSSACHRRPGAGGEWHSSGGSDFTRRSGRGGSGRR